MYLSGDSHRPIRTLDILDTVFLLAVHYLNKSAKKITLYFLL